MTEADTVVVRRQIVVHASIEQAFAAFTRRFGDFKPPEHNLMATPIEETVFEPRVGGHIYDRGADGTVCRWARVLAFDPPARVVFSWDISPRWTVENDPQNASEVEVTFVAETSRRTRVELEHRNLDRHGPGWEAVRDGVDNDAGWPLYLTRFAELCKVGSVRPVTGTGGMRP
ncbi:MAG: SRPBCC family protein [Candidatus Dormibacteraceae bacterium]